MLNIDEAKAALLNLLQKKSVFHGDFTLSSGAKSNYYIDCRLTTFDPEGLPVQIAAEVSQNPNGIGYVGLAYTRTTGIKVMPIEGVLPSTQTVHAKTYPYARPTFYYTNGEPAGLAKQFLDFTIGPAGQKTAAQVGFVPLP